MRSSALLLPLLAASAVSLSACSSRVERFDRPSWGLNGQTSSLPRASDRYVPSGEPPREMVEARPHEAPRPPAVNMDERRSAPAYAPVPAPSRRTATAPVAPGSPYTYRGGRDPVTGRAELREGAGATGASVPAQPDVPAQYGGSTQGETIEVQSGDTLYAIARRYNVSVMELKSANGLSSDSVYAGQRLTLPIR